MRLSARNAKPQAALTSSGLGLDKLYDLVADPGETRNLYGAAKHAAVREELQGRLTAWQKSIDDPLLRDRRKAER